jgi:MFS family permease
MNTIENDSKRTTVHKRASYATVASDEINHDGLLLTGIPNSADNTSWESNGDGISIDDAIDRLQFGKFQRTILIAAGLCFASDAMQVIALSFLTPFLRSSWNLSNASAASITSLLFAGAMVGTLVLGPLSDAMGRRSIFLCSATIISVFGFGTALAPNFACLLIVLFGVGIGVGGLTVPFDVLAEFLPAEKRGTHLLFIEYFWTAGCLYVVAIAFCFLQNNHWRVFMSLCAVPCVLSLFVGYLYVPESPRWLASKGRLDEALDILKYAASMNGQEDIDIVFPSRLRILPEPEYKHASIRDLLQPKWRWIMLRLWGAWCKSFCYDYCYSATKKDRFLISSL